MPLSPDNIHHIDQFAQTEFGVLEPGREQMAAMTLIERLAANGWSMAGVDVPEELSEGTIVQTLTDPKTAVAVVDMGDEDLDEARYIFCAGLYKAAIGAAPTAEALREKLVAVKGVLDARFNALPAEVVASIEAATRAAFNANADSVNACLNGFVGLMAFGFASLFLVQLSLSGVAVIAPEGVSEGVASAAEALEEVTDVLFICSRLFRAIGPVAVPLITVAVTLCQGFPDPARRARVAGRVPDLPAEREAVGEAATAGSTAAMLTDQGGVGVGVGVPAHEVGASGDEPASAVVSATTPVVHRSGRFDDDPAGQVEEVSSVAAPAL